MFFVVVVINIVAIYHIMHVYACIAYRFGKVLWFNLPEDVLASDEPWNVKTFAQFVFFDTIHSQIFDTE